MATVLVEPGTSNDVNVIASTSNRRVRAGDVVGALARLPSEQAPIEAIAMQKAEYWIRWRIVASPDVVGVRQNRCIGELVAPNAGSYVRTSASAFAQVCLSALRWSPPCFV
jgi:hypothetical protein